jgi:DNA-binding beta-propeller fold protein YncE
VFVSGTDWFLSGDVDRRTLLKGVSGAVLGLLGSAAGLSAPAPAVAAAESASSPPEATVAAAEPAPATAPTETQETVYVFNVGSKDVTLIDAPSRRVRETRPLGASVRWLSNEQTYWDGSRIWTYDFPGDQVQAIAIDPRQVAITRTISGIGKGPGHSLMVLPDRKTAAINVAGDDRIAFLDLEAGQVAATVKTGAFP